jgi:DNA-binding GntR family transcriptional regulator
VAQPIEQAPPWVRQLLPSREEREAQHAEAQAILEAIRGGDRSRVMTVEELIREMDAEVDDSEKPGA